MSSVSISNYGQYTSDNYGAHTQVVSIGRVDYYFSYKTCVAVRVNGKLHVCENVWGPTTGKHLNWIDCGHKSERMHYDAFEALLAKIAHAGDTAPFMV
jgi:hypothetical protein